jgi:uncharacterized damage-inducible protein DinB
MELLSHQLNDLLIAEVHRRIFEEGRTRIHLCLDSLSEEEVWHRPNEHTNPVGNLVLHLCGNVRQWVVAGLGGRADSRQRSQEFEKHNLSKEQLKIHLRETLEEVRETLAQISPEDLVKSYPVQVYEEKGVSILVHVMEHFSYHVGQMTLLVKMLKNKDMGYYEEALE